MFLIELSLFQDGLEFSSPKIHTPFYNIDETCNPYAKDDRLFLETFQKHLNQPIGGVKAGAGAVHPSALLLLSLALCATRYFSQLSQWYICHGKWVNT